MHIYLETAPKSGLFNHRGEAGPGDDPDSYTGMMAKSKLRVITTADYQGARIEQREAAPEAAATGQDNVVGD